MTHNSTNELWIERFPGFKKSLDVGIKIVELASLGCGVSLRGWRATLRYDRYLKVGDEGLRGPPSGHPLGSLSTVSITYFDWTAE